MIYKGLRIRTPNSNEFIHKYTDKKGNDYYTFLSNQGKKNEETGKFEVTERYEICVYDIKPNIASEIIVTELVGCKPKISKSKDGREFLNCCVFVRCENTSKTNNQYNNQYNNNSNNNNGNQGVPAFNNNYNTEDLPF